MVLANELRNSVYQFAFQGKLTNKIGVNESNLLSYETEHMPYDLPQHWKWVTFGEMCESFSTGPFGTMLHKSDYDVDGIPLVNPMHMKNGRIIPSNDARVSILKAKDLSSYSLHEGDIVLARRGELGRGAIVSTNEEGWICGTGSFFIKPKQNINPNYLMMAFRIPYVRFMLLGKSVGTTMNNLNQTILKSVPLPLPPIEEQQRIVDRVNELMKQIDEYAKIEQQLISLKDSFPGDLRSAILQAAMQGKLTEQSVNDTDVDDFIKSARNQRKLLIANKEIKNEKLYKISNEDYPYEIPESWRFIRLGEVIRLQSGQDMTPDMYSDVNSEGVPYLTGASNIDNGKVIINRWTKSPKAIAEKGDLLLTCKGTVGLLAFLNEERVHIARQIMSIKPLASVNLGYIKYCIDSFILLLKAKAKSEIPGIDRKVVHNLLIPLPPIEEQGRIVERLDALLPLCESVMEE